jgi:hypothetical protein
MRRIKVKIKSRRGMRITETPDDVKGDNDHAKETAPMMPRLFKSGCVAAVSLLALASIAMPAAAGSCRYNDCDDDDDDVVVVRRQVVVQPQAYYYRSCGGCVASYYYAYPPAYAYSTVYYAYPTYYYRSRYNRSDCCWAR